MNESARNKVFGEQTIWKAYTEFYLEYTTKNYSRCCSSSIITIITIITIIIIIIAGKYIDLYIWKQTKSTCENFNFLCFNFSISIFLIQIKYTQTSSSICAVWKQSKKWVSKTNQLCNKKKEASNYLSSSNSYILNCY